MKKANIKRLTSAYNALYKAEQTLGDLWDRMVDNDRDDRMGRLNTPVFELMKDHFYQVRMERESIEILLKAMIRDNEQR